MRSYDWKSLFLISLIGTVVVALVAWLIAEFACTRSFVGALVSKTTTVWYSYDEERTTVHTDDDGHTTVSRDGDDETVAHERYVLTFYVDGRMREVSAGTRSAKVPYVRADALALRRLRETTSEPPVYTHASVKRQYLVKVSGWLIDGTVKELVDLATIKAE